MANTVNIKADKLSLAEKLLCLYVMLIPIMRVPSLPIFGQKIQYSDLIVPIILVVWLTGLLQRKKYIKLEKIDFFILVALALLAVSVVISPNQINSGIEYIGILYLLGIYFLIKQLVVSADTWWKIIKFWAIVGFVVSSIGITAYITAVLTGHSNFFIKEYAFVSFLGPRILSTFRNPSMLATYLHVTLIVGFILLRKIQELNKKTFWVYLLIGMCLAASFLTKTRIIAGIILSLFLILMLPQKSKMLLWGRYIALIVFIPLSLLVFATTIWWIFPVDIKTNGEKLKIELNLTHFSYHNYNKAAWAMIKDRPYFGVGMGMYNSRLMDYVNLQEMESSFHVAYPDYEKGRDPHSLLVKQSGKDPHSTYLGWAAETGLFGLSAIAIIIFSYCLKLVSRFKRETNDFNKYILWCLFAGICGFLLNGFYVDILTMRHFWVLIAMAAALLSIVNLKEKSNGVFRSYPCI